MCICGRLAGTWQKEERGYNLFVERGYLAREVEAGVADGGGVSQGAITTDVSLFGLCLSVCLSVCLSLCFSDDCGDGDNCDAVGHTFCYIFSSNHIGAHFFASFAL